jgi:hypothetical protein
VTRWLIRFVEILTNSELHLEYYFGDDHCQCYILLFCICAMSGERYWPGLIAFCSARFEVKFSLRNLNHCLCFQFICSKFARLLGIFNVLWKRTKTFMLITQVRAMVFMFLPILCLCRGAIRLHVWLIYITCISRISLKNEQSLSLHWLLYMSISFMILLSF